mmetsp:Transcript_6624/g.29166  ORF Transcript_6624/g.29166 Transcript_6624/m.29166 type:complete len:244 (+) Transcript_6624:1234-1965(+)
MRGRTAARRPSRMVRGGPARGREVNRVLGRAHVSPDATRGVRVHGVVRPEARLGVGGVLGGVLVGGVERFTRRRRDDPLRRRHAKRRDGVEGEARDGVFGREEVRVVQVRRFVGRDRSLQKPSEAHLQRLRIESRVQSGRIRVDRHAKPQRPEPVLVSRARPGPGPVRDGAVVLFVLFVLFVVFVLPVVFVVFVLLVPAGDRTPADPTQTKRRSAAGEVVHANVRLGGLVALGVGTPLALRGR